MSLPEGTPRIARYTWWRTTHESWARGLVHPSDLHGIFAGLIHSKNWVVH